MAVGGCSLAFILHQGNPEGRDLVFILSPSTQQTQYFLVKRVERIHQHTGAGKTCLRSEQLSQQGDTQVAQDCETPWWVCPWSEGPLSAHHEAAACLAVMDDGDTSPWTPAPSHTHLLIPGSLAQPDVMGSPLL